MNLEHELSNVLEQEARLVFSEFDASTAWRIGSALRTAALERGVAVAIDIRCLKPPGIWAQVVLKNEDK